uniref:Pectinesterase inhibitor domain-containing protein n=1 Tax=Kalanchoe fedtschenkoi TaxID=63787 RepID=A0A7N1A2E1_KALFE
MGLSQAAKLIWLLLCIIWLPRLGLATSSEADENVREACSVTRYVDVCIHSLAPYSTKTPKSNYTAWARAGVSVALLELKNTKGCLEKMNKQSRKWRGGGIADCVECFGAAVDNLHQSLGVLRELDKVTFDEQMSDVITWMSAALTYEDTCIDGLEEGGLGKGRRRRKKKKVMDRVRNCSYVTSNALALLNKLASTGF